jgi:Methyltransferase domain
MHLEELAPGGGKASLMKWEGRFFDGNGGVIHPLVRHRQISLLKPRRVLEVGFGRGLNLLCLSQAFPEVQFAGLELTKQGIAGTRALDANPLLPDALRQFRPFPIPAKRQGPRLDLRKGSAASMPFAHGEFDLVFSRQALEQMEASRPLVMLEMRRFCRGHAAVFEDFREWNTSGFRRRRNEAPHYFNCGLTDLAGMGFAPAWPARSVPIKPCMAVGLAVSAVKS